MLGGYRLSYLLKDLARAMRSMESNEASYKKTRGSFPLPVSTFPIKRETASRDFVSGKLAQKEEIVSSKSAVANFPSKSYHSGNTLWYCMLAIVVLCGISVISCLNWIVLSRQLSLIRSKTWLNNEAAIHHMSFNRSKHLDLLQQSLICHESEN